MQDPMDDIARQARQGSVAAIIQVLNEKLADARIRTRAVFAEGVLQLLCEAAEPEQLDQSVLVSQIRQILEEIAPRNIRRVMINSRIVQEQQLLWLEEISRNPEHLLWSEEIMLTKPNLFKQWTQGLKSQPTRRRKPKVFPKIGLRQPRGNSRFWGGITSGVSLCLLLIIGWLLYDRFNAKPTAQGETQATNSPAEPSPTPIISPTPVSSSPADPFAEAVRLAIEADAAGKTAQTAAQWLDLAAKWEQASDLMSAVKSNHPRYQVAQDRVILYRQNSQLAQDQARQKRSP